MGRAWSKDLDARKHRMARLAASLEALSPLGVLARGYSLTLKADGQSVLRAAGEVQLGEIIQTRLATGRLTSRVEHIEEP